jgi:hypothetical protein
MTPCSCCFTDTLAKCEEEIRLFITLPVYASYRWVITDKFGHKYQGTLTPHADGGYAIPVDELPAGLLTQYSGSMKLEIFEEGDSACSPVNFFAAGMYDCIEFSITGGTFEKNNLGCEVECSGEASYTEYIATLLQENADAPVATVISNTLGGTVVWSYDAVGQYSGTLAGAFPVSKTFITSSGDMYTTRLSNSAIGIFTMGDGVLNGSSYINVRVYE